MEEGGVYDIYCSPPAEGNREAFYLLGAPMSSSMVGSHPKQETESVNTETLLKILSQIYNLQLNECILYWLRQMSGRLTHSYSCVSA